ncbi:MAG TPA: family 43 glycosylhydrolase [Candidatus Onthomonas avicola]|nr:family 43 glycosylhydrolase [Candidatus Onthomonas avicola]
MPNPYLPAWEYIPDGEPRVFGDRIYIYGSHDRPGSDSFCDHCLKVWSAPVDRPSDWTCHGVSFSTRDTDGHPADVDWTDRALFAPDVVEKDGKYYLYAYIVDRKGCVAVSDRPEGPFTLLSQYVYRIENQYDNGTFIDPGVLVDDDGRVYLYCGYLRSYMAELDPKRMYEVLDGTYREDILPAEEPFCFFEACSPRKCGDLYYLIYSPKRGSCLDYATSESPCGPFTYRGTIIDNGIDYPAGNNHGSICRIGNQWYVFYHRMTNGTITSRRGCVERIEILPDGTIPQVEMTSLGFEEALNPYRPTPADTACYLTGGCFITEHNPFVRVITQITDGCVMGWKYFDFGCGSDSRMTLLLRVRGCGCRGTLHVCLDRPDGPEIAAVPFGADDALLRAGLAPVEGRHALYLRAETDYSGWLGEPLRGRCLLELSEFLFQR